MARSAEPSISPREVLDSLEEAIEELRVAYEKYFQGVERAAPVRLRSRVEREVRLLERLPVRSTALRFRMGGLRARFVTYKHYWTRVEHEIERGMSRRDLMKMRRLMGAPPPPGADAPPPAEAEASPAPPPAPAGKLPRTGPPPAVDPAAAGLDPRHLRDVFKQLVQAKRAAGESMDGLTYASLCKKLALQAPKLKQKHKCDQVKFEVETVDGKVRLRARPG